MSTHTMHLVEPLHALDVELAQFAVSLTVNRVAASGDGWTSPREPAHYELDHVQQVHGPFIDPRQLWLWAEAWVEDNQARITEDIASQETW